MRYFTRANLLPFQFLAPLAGLSLLLTMLQTTALADTVFLKDGKEYEGKVISVSRFAVVFRLKDTERLRSFKREEIDTIIYSSNAESDAKTVLQGYAGRADGEKTTSKKDDGAEPTANENADETKKEDGEESTAKKDVDETKKDDGEESTAKKDAGETKKEDGEGPGETAGKGETGQGDEDAEKTAGEAKKSSVPELPKEIQEKVDEQMARFESNNPAERSDAKQKLLTLGKEIIPALISGLNHQNVYARSCSADLLGEFTARNTIKSLIEVFYSVMPQEGQAPTYQRNYVRSLKVALERTTGRSFISVEPKSPLVQKGLQEYIDWYKQEYDRLPPQVGEEEIDPTDPEYVAKLKKARELQLKKREWPRPKLSVDEVVGGTNVEPKADKADEDFRKNFPKADRESAGGVIGESDKQYGRDFFK